MISKKDMISLIEIYEGINYINKTLNLITGGGDTISGEGCKNVNKIFDVIQHNCKFCNPTDQDIMMLSDVLFNPEISAKEKFELIKKE